MDVATAQPVPPPGGDAGNIRYYAEDRSSPVNGDGILPAPQVLIPKTGDANILVDNEIVGSFPTKASRIYWHAK